MLLENIQYFKYDILHKEFVFKSNIFVCGKKYVYRKRNREEEFT